MLEQQRSRRKDYADYVRKIADGEEWEEEMEDGEEGGDEVDLGEEVSGVPCYGACAVENSLVNSNCVPVNSLRC